MANISKSALLKFTLDGTTVDAPIEWEDISINSTFEDGVQPSITTSEFKFVNEGADLIRQYILDGNIFTGMPISIQAYNKDGSISVFNGFLDLSDNFEDVLSEPEVRAKIRKDSSLDTLNGQLSDLTYGHLESIGVFTQSDYEDLDYKVIKPVQPLELIITGITIYLIFKELEELVRNLLETVATGAGDFAGGFIGPLGAIAFFTLDILAKVAYAILILGALIKLLKELVNLLLPPTRQHKVLKWKTALSKVAEHLGYNFISPIEEWDFLYYLPSNQTLEDIDSKTGLFSKISGTQSGIPQTVDYGYNCTEMFSSALETFNARLVIIGKDLHLRTDSDPFWIKTSTFEIPASQWPLIESQKYNTQDLKANVTIEMDTDLRDSYTVGNYKGTAYEIKTNLKGAVNKNANFLKGQDPIQLNYCHANRKDTLNIIEKGLLILANKGDGLIKKMGGTPILAKLVLSKLGMLKVSDNEHSKPKIVYLVNGRIPADYRDKWSAKVLWDKYHSYKSFVSDNYVGQKFLYENVEIPFGLEDFIKLTNNAYFTNFVGEVSKATKFNWVLGADTATIDFWTRKSYTKKLTETKIEAK